MDNPYQSPQTDSFAPVAIDGSFWRRAATRTAILAALAADSFLICFLWALIHEPYHPPHDMSSLLGAGDLEVAWAYLVILSLCWLFGAW